MAFVLSKNPAPGFQRHFYQRYGFHFAEMPKASGMYLRIA